MAEAADLGRRVVAVKVGKSVRPLTGLEAGRFQVRCNAAGVVRRAAPAELRLVIDLLRDAPAWLGFAEIVMLWLAITATTVAFFRCSKVAGWLLVPYLAWVSFAAVLNFAIWRWNI